MKSVLLALAGLVIAASPGGEQVITPIGDINANVGSTGLATPDLEEWSPIRSGSRRRWRRGIGFR
jgi:hypothetical protein